MKKAFWIPVLVGLLAGCATMNETRLSSFGQSRIVEAPFHKLFVATGEVFKERDYEIKKADEATGFIDTEYRSGGGWSAGNLITDRRSKLRARIIKIDEQTCKLELEIFSEVYDLETGWQLLPADNDNARRVYESFFDAIIAKAQGRLREKI